MDTGLRATFVISWSQTELDGTRAAPVDCLRAGATWSWTGEAVRVDGPMVEMPRDRAETPEMRLRAATLVRRLLRAAESVPARDEPDAPAVAERGFTITDGRRTWTTTVIAAGAGSGRPPLLMFLGAVPLPNAEYWVVGHSADITPSDPQGAAPGGVICFTPGTMILCEDGPRPVESITEGTRIQTKDNGCQEVIWRGERRVSGARLYAMPHLAPVRMHPGALGLGVPDAGLLVSPDHRVVLRGIRAVALFNADEVLVAARDLVDDRAITVDRSVRDLLYIHLLLPRHQIVFANAVETESFHPASAALETMGADQLARLVSVVPDAVSDPQDYGGFARRVLSRSEAAIIMHDA